MGLPETRKIYEGLDEYKKLPVIKFLQRSLRHVAKKIRKEIELDHVGWFAKYHQIWGMAVRNDLRKSGFGEDYWPVDNLDDIYVSLVEEALCGEIY